MGVGHWLHELRDPHTGEWTSGGASSNPLKVESGVPDGASTPSLESYLHDRTDLGGVTPPMKGPVAKEVLDHFTDTEEKWSVKLPDGEQLWDQDRMKTHEASVERMFHADKDPDAPLLPTAPDGQKRALFTAGVPASGKSSALAKAEAGTDTAPRVKAILDARSRMVPVNADNHKDDLPEFQRMSAAYDPYSGHGVHEESSVMMKQTLARAYGSGNDVFVDGVGDSEGAPKGGKVGKFHAKLREAVDNGYETHVTVATIPTEEALQRAYKRALGNGRWVPASFIEAAARAVSARHLEWRNDPDVSWDVYDNDVPKGQPPILIARKGKGYGPDGIEIVNHELYAKFLARAEKAKGA